jgi:hypothetical protein
MRLLPLLALATVLACSPATESREAFISRDSAGIAIAENTMEMVTAECMADSVPTVRIGGQEDDDDYFLYRVMGSDRLSDGRIVVVNQGTQEVRWYGPDGKLVGRAGRAGQGPGEFSDAFLVYHTTGDTVWVGDYRPWQWHVFGPDMQFHRTVRMMPNEINSPRIAAVMADGQQLFGVSRVGQRENFAMDSVSIQRHASDGSLIDTVLTMPFGRMGQMGGDPSSIWMAPWFEPSAQAEGIGNRFVVATWGEPELTVYRVDQGFTPARIIRWTTGDRAIPSNAVESARERLANQYPDLDPAMKARMIDPMIDPARPVADRFPALSGIITGRDGRIWVRTYQAPGAVTNEWIAFTAEGRAECRMSLPVSTDGSFAVSEIGADYLLASGRDSLGVEWVGEYRIRGAGR